MQCHSNLRSQIIIVCTATVYLIVDLKLFQILKHIKKI
jgi:hypothetical protein